MIKSCLTNCRYVAAPALLLVFTALLTASCGSSKVEKKRDDFFTSGSRDADQRATQRMAKQEQLAGSGEGAGERGKKVVAGSSTNSTGASAPKVEGKQALYERLGGELGISNIVTDFVSRALQDPRVNWQRKGAKSGQWFGRRETAVWTNSPQNVARLEKHLAEFLFLATGGPAHYEGRAIKEVHAGMRISNAEFDATVGDLKASLDKLQIPNKEQKELLAIVESTRPQVVTQR
jgi:hemoglobin